MSKADNFRRQAESYTTALHELIEQLPNTGDTEETSQKLTLRNGLNQFEMALNGVKNEDVPEDFEFPIEYLPLPDEPDY